MNLNFYPFIPVASGILFASVQGHCDADVEARIGRLETDMKKVRGETAYGNYGAKTPSAASQIDGYGLFITADFLWWKLYEGGTDYVFVDKKAPAVTPNIGPMKHFNFEWQPGFKVGVGYLFEHDGWDAYADFTYFKTEASHSFESDVLRFYPLFGQESFPLFDLHAHWHVDFYDINLVLGRNFFVSKYLSLRPFFGLATAWIDQHRRFSGHRIFDNLIVLKGKNDFWGIGPRLGLDAQFFFCENFSLFGNFFGDLLWGDFHVKEFEDNKTSDFEFYNLRYNLHRMVPAIGFGLGAAYETNLNGDRYHFMIKAGYENQYWWRQNQLPIFDSLSTAFERWSEDLSLQGLTVEFRLDF